MKGKDQIKDLFSDKLGGFEAPVRPDLWTNIASQIGTGTASVASTGLSLLAKSIIGVGIGAAVVTTVVLLSPKTESRPVNHTSVNTTETKISEPSLKKDEPKVSVENIRPEKQKSVVKTVETNSPKTVEATEIDPNQNFKSDISLIDALKEKQSNRLVEKNEQTSKKETKKEGNKSNEEKKEQTKEAIKTVSEEKQVEEIKVKSYTLGELPNVFTPNGDGNNDILFIESEGLVDFTIVVLDAKQKVVFESNDPYFKWNGVDKFGNMVNAGSYVYYIIARDKNENKVNKFIALEVRL